MKKVIFLSVLVFCFVLITPIYALDQIGEVYLYNHSAKYQGPFDVNRVYLFNEADGIWQTFLAVNHFKCREARSSLEITGMWVGNISDDGKCLGDIEAPKWVSGNYLNFQHKHNK